MGIDRVKISLHVNAEKETQIYNVLSSLRDKKTHFKLNRVTGVGKWYYDDIRFNYTIELILPYNNLYITFNGTKTDSKMVNVGSAPYKKVKQNIAFIQANVEEFLGMKLPNFLSWKFETIEINKDTVHSTFEEKEAVLKTLNKNDGGHFIKKDTKTNGSDWATKSTEIKCYDKELQVLNHYIKGFTLPKSISRRDLSLMTRLEVSFSHSKVKATVNRLLGTSNDIITLEDIINPYVLVSLFNGVMCKFNLTVKIQSFDKSVKLINKNIKSLKMQEKLINFVKLVNEVGVNVAKQKSLSVFYRYRKTLTKIGVNIMCLIGDYVFNPLLDYNYANMTMLKKFLDFFQIPTILYTKYNMYTLFCIFQNFTIPFRL